MLHQKKIKERKTVKKKKKNPTCVVSNVFKMMTKQNQEYKLKVFQIPEQKTFIYSFIFSNYIFVSNGTTNHSSSLSYKKKKTISSTCCRRYTFKVKVVPMT